MTLYIIRCKADCKIVWNREELNLMLEYLML